MTGDELFMAMTLCKGTFLVCEALERQHRALLIWLNEKVLFEMTFR